MTPAAGCRASSRSPRISPTSRGARSRQKLRLARSVQQRMYPASPPGTCGFDVAGTAIPADETGGDYYDFLRLPRGGLALAVGDVSGHGFDAALHMVQARTMLHALILTAVRSWRDPRAVEQPAARRTRRAPLRHDGAWRAFMRNPVRCAMPASVTPRATCSGRAGVTRPIARYRRAARPHAARYSNRSRWSGRGRRGRRALHGLHRESVGDEAYYGPREP